MSLSAAKEGLHAHAHAGHDHAAHDHASHDQASHDLALHQGARDHAGSASHAHAARFSLLRMSAGARLGLACAPVAMIWLAIFWARG